MLALLGLIMVVTSFAEHLTISVNASRNLLPDVDNLLGDLRSSYRELCRSVARIRPQGGKKKAGKKKRRSAARKS